jgi:hypothetical protein
VTRPNRGAEQAQFTAPLRNAPAALANSTKTTTIAKVLVDKRLDCGGVSEVTPWDTEGCGARGAAGGALV